MDNQNFENEKEILREKRRKKVRLVLTYTLFILGSLLIIGIIVGTILDLGAFTQFSAHKEQIHHFTQGIFTSCVGLLCLVLAFERKFDFDSIEATLEKQNATLQKQEEHFGIQNTALTNISSELGTIHHLTDMIHTQTNIIEQMHHVSNKHFDPLLKAIFKDFIDDTIDFFKNGIENKKIIFTEYDRFEKAYSKCLEELKGCHFMATSSAHSNYFWTKEGEVNNTLEDSIVEFIKSGGTITRIFFVEPEDFKDLTTISVLNKQVSLGVEVFTISKNEVSKDNYKYFVVDDCKRILWHAYTDENKFMTKFVYSANHRDIERHHGIFETLKSNRRLKRYAKQPISRAMKKGLTLDTK